MSRKEGGNALASIDDEIDASTPGLVEYIKKNKERLITAANNKIGNTSTKSKRTTEKNQKWE